MSTFFVLAFSNHGYNSEMQEGQFEYKYIIDGEWTHNEQEPFTGPNKDGHTNNYAKVKCLFSLNKELNKF